MKPQTFLAAMAFFVAVTACKKEVEVVKPPIAVKAEKSFAKLGKAKWLLGEWSNTSKDGVMTESWRKANDSLYKGQSFVVVGNDTVFAEYIDLSEGNGILTYTVSVKDQNKEAPVPFEMTVITNDTIVFENPEHDFPNKIIYRKVAADSLVATISGTQGGKPASQDFSMKKQK